MPVQAKQSVIETSKPLSQSVSLGHLLKCVRSQAIFLDQTVLSSFCDPQSILIFVNPSRLAVGLQEAKLSALPIAGLSNLSESSLLSVLSGVGLAVGEFWLRCGEDWAEETLAGEKVGGFSVSGVAIVDEVVEVGYTYSPSMYCAPEAKVVRFSRRVYRCSSL